MIVTVKREKAKTRVLYYAHIEGRAVAKVITDLPESLLLVRGFMRVSYYHYLRERRSIRAKERKEQISHV